jgi:O-antigen/teichoic acid export membrane protein
MLGMAAVTYYATPFDVVTKVLVIPASTVAVLFPAFSTANSLDRDRMATLYRRGAKFTLLILFPILLATIVFAREGLSLWLGATFASHSTRVLEWLAAGTLLSGLALVPFSLVQGVGRPDLTGKLHLVELPVYAVLLWCLIRSRGIEGAAMAWTIRVGADGLVLFLLSHRLLGLGKLLNWRTVTAAVGALGMMCLGAVVPGLFLEVFLFAFCLVALAMAGWFWLLSPEERGLVQRWAWRAAEVSL